MRENIYPENPYPAGTFLAASWDFRRACEVVGEATKKAMREDHKRLLRFVRDLRRG